MHYLLSKIKHSSDIDRVMKNEFNKNTFYTDNKVEIKKDISKYISYKGASEWFKEEWNVLTEKSIIRFIKLAAGVPQTKKI